MTLSRGLLTTLLWAMAWGCAAPSEDEGEARARTGESAIRSGSVTTEHPAVGLLFYDASWTCTGTQIAADVVLAAAHCAFMAPESGYGVTTETAQDAPRGMMFYPNVDATGRYETTGGIAVDRVYAWKRSVQSADPDVALFHLAAPRKLTRYPAVAAAPPSSDVAVKAVGYGCTSTGTGYYVKRERALGWQADLKEAAINYQSGYTNRRAGGATLCPGDSGGPLYDGSSIFGVASAGHATISFWVDVTLLHEDLDRVRRALTTVRSGSGVRAPLGEPR